MSKDVYKVIKNPLRPMFKYEVWIYGEYTGVSETGYAATKIGARNIKAFFKEQQAEDFIKYQEEVAQFSERIVS